MWSKLKESNSWKLAALLIFLAVAFAIAAAFGFYRGFWR
jgi:hypothetical protein